ncbi:hypothetical protein MLD38_031651 [Melastoma candidum]|uniref:Uncharacterized protein n=1 Tax=Melastoma candidum TaxID=119954 RepID=A0ACB9MQY7_9MYRT|nr:hypothetical protein MLD38_031651 [Melastoma candidum]
MGTAPPAAEWEGEVEVEVENPFSRLSDDVILNILFKLEEDPRHWSRIACVSTKFSSLVRNFCWKSLCLRNLPPSLFPIPPSPSAWSSLHKLSVCCPGLLHSGLLLDNSDFGLLRDLGPDPHPPSSSGTSPADDHDRPLDVDIPHDSSSDHGWTLFDDLYHDTVYSNCEDSAPTDGCANVRSREEEGEGVDSGVVRVGKEAGSCKRRKVFRSMRSHMASGARNLCREQGNKLLASRFRGDCLYICDWPGCVHIGDKRNYMLFRGVFKNFKRSGVWRTINDRNRSKINLQCAFCSCNQTWDLHSAFCLRRGFGYHDDGEPVVRAYVCENGHISGAWTDLPLYA